MNKNIVRKIFRTERQLEQGNCLENRQSFFQKMIGYFFVKSQDFDKKIFRSRQEAVEKANPVNEKKLTGLC